MDQRPDRRGRHAREPQRARRALRAARAPPVRRPCRLGVRRRLRCRHRTSRPDRDRRVVPRRERDVVLRVPLRGFARARCALRRRSRRRPSVRSTCGQRPCSRSWRGWSSCASQWTCVSWTCGRRSTHVARCRATKLSAELAVASPSIDHLPDITRCAASATASAMSEPSLVALDTMCSRLAMRVSAASRPASRILRARRRAGADRCCRCGESGGEHFLAHRGLGELVDRVVCPKTSKCFSWLDLAIVYLPARCGERHFNAVTVPDAVSERA